MYVPNAAIQPQPLLEGVSVLSSLCLSKPGFFFPNESSQVSFAKMESLFLLLT
jgi:hypothetical protein